MDVFDWLKISGGDGASEMAAGLATGLKERAEKATRSALINKIPGAGLLFTHDIEAGLKITPKGALALAGLAAFGLIRATRK